MWVTSGALVSAVRPGADKLVLGVKAPWPAAFAHACAVNILTVAHFKGPGFNSRLAYPWTVNSSEVPAAAEYTLPQFPPPTFFFLFRQGNSMARAIEFPKEIPECLSLLINTSVRNPTGEDL